MTRAQLAAQIGFHPNALTMYFTGYRKVGIKAAQKIAQFMDDQQNWRDYVEMPAEKLLEKLTHRYESITS